MESFNPIMHSSINVRELKTYKLLLRIRILEKNIPSEIYVQKSNIIKFKLPDNNLKTFYPKIFLSRYEYYTHIYGQLKKIYSYIRMHNNKKFKLVIITHDKEILYC